MTNATIETDIKEILKDTQSQQDKILEEIKTGQSKLFDKVEAIDKRLIKVETKLYSELPVIKEDIKELKSTQNAQVWVLIGILFTAVIGFLVAIGKFAFTSSGI